MNHSSDFSQVTAVLLAGGLGSRLRSVVADRPKVLATIGGRPFLSFILDQISTVQVAGVVLCTGYMGELVEAAFGRKYGSLNLDYSLEPQPLGTGGALRLAAERVSTPWMLVVNGDSYCGVDLYRFYAWHRAKKSRATLLGVEVPDTSRYGRLDVDIDDRVTKFEEKGGRNGPGLINGGWYLLERQLFASLDASRAISLEREAFPAWIDSGLYAFRSQLPFLDIGTPESFAAAEEFFAGLSATGGASVSTPAQS